MEQVCRALSYLSASFWFSKRTSLMIKRYCLCLFILIMSLSAVQAQFTATHTRYLFNGLALNPAYAGLHDRLDVILSGRMQWTGLNQAPKSQNLALHTPVYVGLQQLGAGLSVGNQQMGQSKWQHASFSLNYKLMLTPELRLSMGLQSAFHFFNSTPEDLLVKHPDDPKLQSRFTNFFTPLIGAGFYLYSEKYFVSLSTSDLQSVFGSRKDEFRPPLLNNILLAGGYIFRLSDHITLKPHVFGAINPTRGFSYSLNSSVFYKQRLMFGIALQPEVSLRSLFQLTIWENLRMGYVFDLPLNGALQNTTMGSHELVLGYWFKLFKKHTLIVNPRYF